MYGSMRRYLIPGHETTEAAFSKVTSVVSAEVCRGEIGNGIYRAKSANVAAWRFLRAMRVFAQSIGSGSRDLSTADTNCILALLSCRLWQRARLE
jgi:hypothetical protein